MTSAVREELDEPGMEADAIGGSEPDVLVSETEAGGSNRVGLGETRDDGDVDEPLLKGNQQGHPGEDYAADAVEEDVEVRHHLSRRGSFRVSIGFDDD
ncbi:unnamed protein product [Linum trigynum]|uniref:Uncharacterized protein n=1 Tax=Linum trigynum TaxID=586398 RepID=A0AAV2CP22_9ROSI